MKKIAKKRTTTAIPALVLSAFLVANLFAGCGKGDRDYSRVLTEAASRAVEAGSTHAQLNAVVSPSEGESGVGLTVQGDAWVSMRTPALEARFTVMGMELSLRYVEGRAYLKLGGKWYLISPESMRKGGEDIPAALVDLAASLPEIISSSTAVNYLGKKKVGPFDCIELAVAPDLEAISGLEQVKRLAGGLGMSEAEIVEFFAKDDPEIKVCVQKDEPVIRQLYLAADVELSSLADQVGFGLLPERGRLELTVDFPDYGVEVKVEAPSDAQPFRGL